MKPEPQRRRRALRWIGLAVLGLVLALYIGLPVGMAVAVVFPYREPVGAPPTGFAPVSLTTDDGVALTGWYAPPANGAAVILIHGAGGSREGVRGHADMLARHGYGVLALDLRGHGASEGATNRFGWQGTRDVGAAVAYLRARPEVRAIGGLGSSLGGEALLGAAADYPEVRAIAADGATQRCPEELMALPSERPLYRNFTARVMYAAVQLFSGEAPPRPLLGSMVEADSTRYMLIAGGGDSQEVAFNELFADAVGERAELWVAPGVPHTGALARYPEEYERLVIGFFDAALLHPPA